MFRSVNMPCCPIAARRPCWRLPGRLLDDSAGYFLLAPATAGFVAAWRYRSPGLVLETTWSGPEVSSSGLRDDRGLLYRYRGGDGIDGGEGSFLLCTFWLAHALALTGQLARRPSATSGWSPPPRPWPTRSTPNSPTPPPRHPDHG